MSGASGLTRGAGVGVGQGEAGRGRAGSSGGPASRQGAGCWAVVLRRSIILLHCSVALVGARLAAANDGGAGADARSRFEAALELVARDEARAAEDLVALADADPDSDYAAEALSEAAQLLEERLGHPDRARDLYARIARRYPDSRPSLRARGRLAFLEENLRTGAGPLGEYQRILGGFAGRPPAESRRLMERVVAEHPDFALADRALLWLATIEARDGQLAAAESRFAELERRFPGSESAALAHRGRADARLAAGHPREARALYRELLEPPTPWPAVFEGARAGEHAAGRAIRRELAFFGCLLWLAGYLGVLMRVGRGGPEAAPAGVAQAATAPATLVPVVVKAPGGGWGRMGPELGYYLPVAGLFVMAAATESRPIALATASIAAGGGLIAWACGGAAERLAARGRLGRTALAGLGAATLVSVLALGFAALHKTQLVDFVVETVRTGPDR